MSSTPVLLDRLNPADQDAYLRDIRALAAAIFRETDVHFAGMDVPYHRGIELDLLESLLQWACEVDAVGDPATRRAFDGALTPYLEPWQSMPPVRSLDFLALLCQLPTQTFFNTVGRAIADPERPDKLTARFEQQKGRTKAEYTGTLQGLRRWLAAYVSDSAGTPGGGEE